MSYFKTEFWMYEILKDRFKNIYIGELTRNVTDWMWRQNKSSEISLSGSIKQVDDSTDNWERQYRRENRFSEEENKYSLEYVWFEMIEQFQLRFLVNIILILKSWLKSKTWAGDRALIVYHNRCHPSSN